ncbi:MAG: 50S ribosomal protein L22 [Gaiellaceae bacterium]
MAQTQTDAPVQARAKAKYVRSTPRKAQLVAEQIRGLPVPEARTVLAFNKRAAARDIEKVLSSAVANAEANHDLIGDELFVREAYVGQGPVLKRWRARARGRVGRIHKRTCHIVVGLAELDEELRMLYAEQGDAAAAMTEPDVVDSDVDEAVSEDVEPEDAVPDEHEAAGAEAEEDAAPEEAAAPEASDVTEEAPEAVAADAAEPYPGYSEHTAKEVIKEVSELTDEQLAAVAAQDERVTVLRAIEKEQTQRSEATDEDQKG